MLRLSANHLIGTLPSQIGLLTNLLQSADGNSFLAGNKLEGRLPTELGRLTEVESLKLFRNSFVGGLPTELGNLVGLTSAMFPYSNQVRRGGEGG